MVPGAFSGQFRGHGLHGCFLMDLLRFGDFGDSGDFAVAVGNPFYNHENRGAAAHPAGSREGNSSLSRLPRARFAAVTSGGRKRSSLGLQ